MISTHLLVPTVSAPYVQRAHDHEPAAAYDHPAAPRVVFEPQHPQRIGVGRILRTRHCGVWEGRRSLRAFTGELCAWLTQG